MAGRGRGRAAFPEVRHQLRRPKDGEEESTAVGPEGDAEPETCKPDPPASTKQEDGVIRGICTQFKYLQASESEFVKLIGLLLDKVKAQQDIDEVANAMHELCQLGPEQAEVACKAVVVIADMEIDGYKLRTKLLTRMQLEFEGFEEKAESSPQSFLCNAIFLCGFYTRYRLQGKPVHLLRAPVWKYLTYMLESRKQFYLDHCFQLVKSKMKFFVQNNLTEVKGDFLTKLRDLVLDEKVLKATRSSALETLQCIWLEMPRDDGPPQSA